MKKIILLILVAVNVHGQTIKWTESCFRAYEETSKLNFNKARQLIETERRSNPANLVIPYIESQADFIKVFISESESDLESLKKKNAQRLEEVDAIEGEDPYSNLFRAEYHLQIAVARLKFEEYIGAVYETRKALKLLESNRKKYPEFHPNLRSLGFIHAFVGTVPRNYQWVINLLGFSGTMEQGLAELTELLDATYHKKELRYLKDETIVLLTFMEMNMVKNKGSAGIRKRLNNIENIHQKPLLLFAKSVFHFANSENDSVISLLSKKVIPEEAYNLYYLDYMEGIARLNKLDLTAEKSFYTYVRHHQGFSFVKSAYQKLAWIRLLQEDMTGYKKLIALAGDAKIGGTFSDEDKQALKEFQTKEIPNVHLLKSRLLFDGGYYHHALHEIAGKPPDHFPSLRDKIEFTYRLARIFEKTNKVEKAIEYYKHTITNGKSHDFYFAANSALLLGLHYENEGNNKKAEEYYRLCLSMRNHEYQNSLDQKAKAGLSRVVD